MRFNDLLISDFWAKFFFLIDDSGPNFLLIINFWAKIFLISDFRCTPLRSSLTMSTLIAGFQLQIINIEKPGTQ